MCKVFLPMFFELNSQFIQVLGAENGKSQRKRERTGSRRPPGPPAHSLGWFPGQAPSCPWLCPSPFHIQGIGSNSEQSPQQAEEATIIGLFTPFYKKKVRVKGGEKELLMARKSCHRAFPFLGAGRGGMLGMPSQERRFPARLNLVLA